MPGPALLPARGCAGYTGCGFAGFLPFDTESQRVTALREGVVDVAVLDTTDGNLATGDLVLLADDRHLQPAENVVPVITGSALARYGKRLAGAVNAVSAQLTSTGAAVHGLARRGSRGQRQGRSARMARTSRHLAPAGLIPSAPSAPSGLAG